MKGALWLLAVLCAAVAFVALVATEVGLVAAALVLPVILFFCLAALMASWEDS